MLEVTFKTNYLLDINASNQAFMLSNYFVFLAISMQLLLALWLKKGWQAGMSNVKQQEVNVGIVDLNLDLCQCTMKPLLFPAYRLC